jgi:hypothetical protein
MRNLRSLDLYSDYSSDAQATQAIENIISKHALSIKRLTPSDPGLTETE